MFETDAEKFMERVFPYDDETPMYGEEQVKGLLTRFAESIYNKANDKHIKSWDKINKDRYRLIRKKQELESKINEMKEIFVYVLDGINIERKLNKGSLTSDKLNDGIELIKTLLEE